jgi:hypothetical protein
MCLANSRHSFQSVGARKPLQFPGAASLNSVAVFLRTTPMRAALSRAQPRGYFFFAGFLAEAAAFLSVIAAWAAARRATGTRKGEQLT